MRSGTVLGSPPAGSRAGRTAPRPRCPRCDGHLFDDRESSYCIACGFREQAETSQAAVAYVLAGGAGRRLGVLTDVRAKPAMPFGGRHRLIDFTLANCANSGVERVAVLARHNWRSVHAALEAANQTEARGSGRLPRQLRMAVAQGDEYAGTASAVRRTLSFVHSNAARSVLVLSADHLYTMDYRRLLELHESRRADLTIAVAAVTADEARRFGIVALDRHGRVRSFVEKPRRPHSTLASMGVYAFSGAALERLLELDTADPASTHDFGHDVIPRALRAGLNVGAYEFDDYWRDVGTIDAYWAASMALVRGQHPAASPHWPLPQRPEYAGTPRVQPGAIIDEALLAGDCAIAGTVRRSIIFPGARIEPGATVLDSVVLPGAVVGRDALVRRAIIDERAVIDEGASVGAALAGISVVAAEAHIPAGFVLARDLPARLPRELRRETRAPGATIEPASSAGHTGARRGPASSDLVRGGA